MGGLSDVRQARRCPFADRGRPFTPAQADALTDAFHSTVEQDDHVTADQVKAGQAELRTEIASLRHAARTHHPQPTELSESRNQMKNYIHIGMLSVALSLLPPGPILTAGQETPPWWPDTEEEAPTCAGTLVSGPNGWVLAGTHERIHDMRRASDPNDERTGASIGYNLSPPIVHAGDPLDDGLRITRLEVVGDVEYMEWRESPPVGFRIEDQEPVLIERDRTRTTSGRLVSRFSMRLTGEQVWNIASNRALGWDWPYFRLGDYRPVLADTESPAYRWTAIDIPWGSGNLPTSTTVRVNSEAQYASHIVNLVRPGHRNDHVTAARHAGKEITQEITNRFYELFTDRYHSIQIVWKDTKSSFYGGFHKNLRQPVKGTGQRTFDNADDYGSPRFLQSVEGTRTRAWMSMGLSNHEIGHQWGDRLNWGEIAGITGMGHQPNSHTPLMHPGETLIGAVLRPGVRVADDPETGWTIERTTGLRRYHPLMLYKMGYLEANEVPEMMVFSDQGQFNPDRASAPAPGTLVEGDAVRVHINDVIASAGIRSGPTRRTWRRATIVVSDRLLSAREMDYWNFYAARLEVRTGVNNRYGDATWHEATYGRGVLRTRLAPKEGMAQAAPPGKVTGLPIARNDFVGFELDEDLPTTWNVGDVIEITFAPLRDDVFAIHGSVALWKPGDEEPIRIGTSPSGLGRRTRWTVPPGTEGLYKIALYVRSGYSSPWQSARLGTVRIQ